MKNLPIRLTLVCVILVSCGGSGRDPALSGQEVRGSYLGQSPPGSVPLQFAPEIITLELHSSPVFSPDGREVFWTEMDGGGIRWMRLVNGVWSGPSDPPFALPNSGEPVFGPLGDTLYFLSAHRFEGSRGNWDEDVWRTARAGSGWTEAQRLPPPVNNHPMHWGVSLAANRNLYVGQTEGAGGIYFSEFRDGEYLFFLRTVNGELTPFWVRATVITDLQPT